MRITLPVYMKVYSTFFRSRLEYDLPAFLCEVVYTGSKRLIILDVHRTGDVAELEKDRSFFDRLMDIRERYPDLLRFQKEAKGGLSNLVASRAVCRSGSGSGSTAISANVSCASVSPAASAASVASGLTVVSVSSADPTSMPTASTGSALAAGACKTGSRLSPTGGSTRGEIPAISAVPAVAAVAAFFVFSAFSAFSATEGNKITTPRATSRSAAQAGQNQAGIDRGLRASSLPARGPGGVSLGTLSGDSMSSSDLVSISGR